jgi:hypothetical protein
MSYLPFKKMEAKLAHKPGVTDPGALAAAIANRKYGKRAVQTAAKSGTSLRHHKQLKRFVERHHGR